MKNIIGVLVTVFIGLAGLMILMLGLLGIFDPVGTQMANDNDPFGEPQSALVSYTITIIGLLVFGSSIYFGFKRGDK